MNEKEYFDRKNQIKFGIKPEEFKNKQHKNDRRVTKMIQSFDFQDS